MPRRMTTPRVEETPGESAMGCGKAVVGWGKAAAASTEAYSWEAQSLLASSTTDCSSYSARVLGG